MYSTKLLNKNVVDNNAYITIGDPYKDPRSNPFRAGKKGEKVPAPFQVKMVPNNAENGNFSKIQYAAGGFQEDIKYITSQPLDSRKKGFGSKDAKRRDEFSNAIRTEQYRSCIKRESVVMGKTSRALQEKLGQLIEERAKTAPEKENQGRIRQYDVGRVRVTEFDQKSIKDTYYHFNKEKGKRLGEYRPISAQYGDNAWSVDYKPPMFGGRSETKNFYDKSHLHGKRS